MALTREQSQIWQAMNVGVQWVLRDGVDPLAPEPKPAAVAVHAPAEAAPAAVSPSATISAGSASAVSAMVRRGPMATRLRRQQAAVGIQSAPPAASTFVKSAPITSAQPSVSLKPAVTPKVVEPTHSLLPNFERRVGKISRRLPIVAASVLWRPNAPTRWWPTAHRAVLS